MKSFPEIIRILEQFREPRIETVDTKFRSAVHKKGFALYDGIRTGKFRNDSIASIELYGSNGSNTSYSTLKSRLQSRLINSLFHLNLKRAGFPIYGQALYRVSRGSFLAHTLITLGGRSAALRIAKRTLELAQQFDLTYYAVDLASILRGHYALQEASRQYDFYSEILNRHLTALNAEYKSWEFYERALLIPAQKQNEADSNAGEIIDGFVEDVKSLLASVQTSTLYINYYRLLVHSHKVSLRFEQNIEACTEAITYLKTVPHIASNSRIAEFSLRKLACAVVIRDYEEGKSAAEECSELIPKDSMMWFGYAEYHVLLLFHTGHFLEASVLFQQVVERPKFASLPDFHRERWKIFELYLHFALRTLPDTEGIELKKKFDLQNFLRFIPTAARDKHGVYIAVIIIHILYMLEVKDFGGIIDRMDSLRTYRSRYLRTGANRRSSLFFKLLTIMENNSFSYRLTRAKSDKYYKQLLNASAEEAETNDELQVIPYEWLWQRVLDKLREFELDYGKK